MQRVMALVASAAFLGAACQPSSGPSAAVPSTPMAAADAKLFAGHYDAAEAAYRALANGGDSAAHAHLAVLLDYENRFGEAVSEARAATRTRADSASLARLTRALDWSEDLAGALAAGKQAVTVLPVDPIAHVYYSEALADSGTPAPPARPAPGGSTPRVGRPYRGNSWTTHARPRPPCGNRERPPRRL